METYSGDNEAAAALEDVRRLNSARGKRPAFYWPAVATLSAVLMLTAVLPAVVAFVLGPVAVIATVVLAFRVQPVAVLRARYSRALAMVQMIGALLTVVIFGLNVWLFAVTDSWVVPVVAAVAQWVMVFFGGRGYERRWSGALSTHA